ncbi:MAG: NAD(P)H-hydrate dehydratase [Sulfurimonas sp.]|nr:NAD(P)H-hydrate dehydratase [Sulfurimonas sp.]MBU3938305.1 NAD(P)H-hydrate dehydratase [bacterium]MBU4025098.1 NAD(P)H-hydrate dehydratase [bacterium]MBU4057969.1 NAD(P)H-hydrate dehydratase [bacterium]MBU4110894.1 NAD(P)H-hydrate dehydratase [bacterium]
MQKIFDEVGSLDQRCYEEFGLSEDILMEHAASGMVAFICKNFTKDAKIIIVCGSGNNGADGLALARQLHGNFNVFVLQAKTPSSEMALLQNARARKIGVKTVNAIETCDVLVDALVGTGFKGDFSAQHEALLSQMNQSNAFKIACDVPSGLTSTGECAHTTFVADVTLTMGALKRSMFLDEAKEFVGAIEVLSLGVSRSVYETQSNWHLLDLDDLKLPYRTKKDSHKGSYGHLALAYGSKAGASVMSANAALRFGAGLVTLVGYENEQVLNIPPILMYSHDLPFNTTAIALGMGLGEEFSDLELENFLDNWLPIVADADIFTMPILAKILKREKVVLTPHAKEFAELLKRAGIADISVSTLQKNRFEYVEAFCEKFPHVTLLLKGANVIIAKGDEFFINPHGTPSLAKGGSGDVLSGLIGALLAQGEEPFSAARNASLAHTKLAQLYTGNDFSLTPYDLIEAIGKL